MWPSTSTAIYKLAQARLIGCLSFLPLSAAPLASDDEAATFAKLKLIDNIETIPLGRPLLVKALTASDNPQYIIPYASQAGCTTELHLIDQMTKTVVHKVPTTKLAVGYARLPPAAAQHIKTCLTITIPNIQAAFKLKSILHNLHEGTWYLSGSESFISAHEQVDAAHGPSDDSPLPSALVVEQRQKPPKREDPDRAAAPDTDSDDDQGDKTPPQPPQVLEDNTVPTLPPAHLEAQHITDPIIVAMVQHATTAIKPETARLLQQFEGWKIPEQISSDNETLSWILENIGLTMNPKYAFGASCDIGPTKQAIAEQIKLNKMRSEAAMLRTMFTDDPGSLPHDTGTIDEAIAKLLPELPKNGGVAVGAATTATTTSKVVQPQQPESPATKGQSMQGNAPQHYVDDVLHGPSITVETSL
jgi:hypothetical protein